MHEYRSSQLRVVTTLSLCFLVNYVGKHFSVTIYVAFQDPGQILKSQHHPGDSGTVGAYVYAFCQQNPT